MSPGRPAHSARWIFALAAIAAACSRGPAGPQPPVGALQMPAAIALAPGDRLRVLATTSIVADASVRGTSRSASLPSPGPGNAVISRAHPFTMRPPRSTVTVY